MQQLEVTEKQVATAIFQFILPFSYRTETEQTLRLELKRNHFIHYQLDNIELETEFYGDYQVSHRELESFFLPMTNKILFPQSDEAKGFQRYSKKLAIEVSLNTPNDRIPFQIHSVDLILCPYELGFMTIRTEGSNFPLSKALEFMNSMAIYKPMETQQQHFTFELAGKEYQRLKDLVDDLFPRGLNSITEELGFDSTIYLQTLLVLNEGESIDRADLSRCSSRYGVNQTRWSDANDGEFYQSVEEFCYHRWAPNTYYLIEDYGLCCISNKSAMMLAQTFYGPLYYIQVITLYYRLFFLKFSQDYAKINLEADKKAMKHLIYTINSFTSNYYFVVFPKHFVGEEFFHYFKKAFKIEILYFNTKEALSALFHYAQSDATKKDSILLLLLTIYTVICGIFSMNLFTHDLEGNIKWQHFTSYNPFEYFAVFIVFSGIIVVLYLVFSNLYQVWQERKIQKKWVKKAVYSPKKQ